MFSSTQVLKIFPWTFGLGLGLGLGLAWGHFQNKYFFVYTSFKDFSLNVYDDTNLLHLVSGSERLSFSQELTPTLTLGLSLGLGLGLAWGDFQNKYFFVYTSFKDFSLNVYDDSNLLHLVSDFQRLSFSQELTPTLTLGLTLGLGLGLACCHFQDIIFFLFKQVLKIFPWTSTTILIFWICFQIFNAYRFPRS